METTLNITGATEYEATVNYISLVKDQLHISRKTEIKALAMMIVFVNELFRSGKVKNKAELKEFIETKVSIKSDISIIDSDIPEHTFNSTLYNLRKTRGEAGSRFSLLNGNNIPYPFKILSPIYPSGVNDESILTVKVNVLQGSVKGD